MVRGYDRLLPLGYKTLQEFFTSVDLLLWIRNKLESFQEQPRKGIPRNASRPMTLKKYSAQLQMLLWKTWRARTLEDIGKAVGCSASQIRKWLAEDPFKKGVWRLRDEYLDGFFKNFLVDLDHLYATASIEGRKDNLARDFEAYDVKRLAMLIEYADDRWGWLLQEEAHKRIETLLKNLVSRGGRNKTRGAGVSLKDEERALTDLAQMPFQVLNVSGHDVDSRAAFLHLLDLVSFARSRGRVAVDSGYLLRFQKAWADANARIHYDLTVARERNNPDTVNVYSEAQSTLSILVGNTLSRTIALMLKKRGKSGGVPEMLPMYQVYTPKGLDIHTG